MVVLTFRQRPQRQAILPKGHACLDTDHELLCPNHHTRCSVKRAGVAFAPTLCPLVKLEDSTVTLAGLDVRKIFSPCLAGSC